MAVCVNSWIQNFPYNLSVALSSGGGGTILSNTQSGTQGSVAVTAPNSPGNYQAVFSASSLSATGSATIPYAIINATSTGSTDFGDTTARQY